MSDLACERAASSGVSIGATYSRTGERKTEDLLLHGCLLPRRQIRWSDSLLP
ncbi:hypothetical protein BDA96_02G213000 [Sorghum bicolor]|uniref:Uncharacterized protein n=1 Tax=Sorghum bicolor TaxID=4558 RepID=A0A921RNF9_SORBI|nr:hypothetical protein BDA96_02G213000 [Sorghum bicolor]